MKYYTKSVAIALIPGMIFSMGVNAYANNLNEKEKTFLGKNELAKEIDGAKRDEIAKNADYIILLMNIKKNDIKEKVFEIKDEAKKFGTETYYKVIYNGDSYVSITGDGELLAADTFLYKTPKADSALREKVIGKEDSIEKIKSMLKDKGYPLKSEDNSYFDNNVLYVFEKPLADGITNRYDSYSVVYDPQNKNIVSFSRLYNPVDYVKPTVSLNDAKDLAVSHSGHKSEDIKNARLSVYRDGNGKVFLAYIVDFKDGKTVIVSTDEKKVIGEDMLKDKIPFDSKDISELRAIKISRALFEKSENAVLVGKSSVSDALCAAPLAGYYGSPILLCDKDAPSEELIKELERLHVKNIYTTSGENVISKKVIDELKGKGYTIHDYSGKDRYETSLKIASLINKDNKFIIASGENVNDIPSISPYAYENRTPILLSKSDALDKRLVSLLNKGSKVISVGGNKTIGDGVYKQLEPKDIKPQIIGGADRYETSAMIVEKLYPAAKSFIYESDKAIIDDIVTVSMSAKYKKPILIVKDVEEQSKIAENNGSLFIP